MSEYYTYSDDGQQTVEATSLYAAAQLVGIPTDAQIEDGGWLVVRDEAGHTVTYGDVPR